MTLFWLLVYGALMAVLWFFVGRAYERIHARYAARISELDSALEDLA